ncbi:hypothetical protein PG984_009755 [Apiospora sp. TS-2023a]
MRQYENASSKDCRFQQFLDQILVGSKTFSTSWLKKSWTRQTAAELMSLNLLTGEVEHHTHYRLQSRRHQARRCEAIEEVSHIDEQGASYEARLDRKQWTPIDEGVLQRILTFSILQQDVSNPLDSASWAQLIPGLTFRLLYNMSSVLACVELMLKQMTQVLRVKTEFEPGNLFMPNGLHSLSAIKLRGWIRGKMGAERSTPGITNDWIKGHITSQAYMC